MLAAGAATGLLGACGACSGVTATADHPATAGRSTPPAARIVTKGRGLHVAGARLENARGRVVRFHGVNRAGTEYACIQGWGIFDGPSDDKSIEAMARWHINSVRIPLNEDCWLGIGGVKPELSGETYRRAIVDYVGRLHRHGMYAELSLMWGAPGSNPATYQSGSPDADHSPAMWASLAQTFKDDPNVVLAPWGETVTDARCFQHGGVCAATYGPHNKPYRTAGMQQAVNVMRHAGYRGVIAVPGIAYANDLSHWLAHRPHDPRRQLVAEAHVYGKNTCDTTRCFNATYAPVARRVPLVLGEMGETYDGSSCGSRYTARIMRWADAHGAGYDAWTWNTWRNCSALITSYSGAPRAAFGRFVKGHYAHRRVRRLPVPAGG